jgi:uncharacterized XkdX family phage protein
MFSIIKRYYTLGIYTNENVKVFVRAGKITEAQYQEITGQVYTP